MVTTDDIRKASTSDLIRYLISPDVVVGGLAGGDADRGGIRVLREAAAAELDRRIPVPA